jgi:hypothetical protein
MVGAMPIGTSTSSLAITFRGITTAEANQATETQLLNPVIIFL